MIVLLLLALVFSMNSCELMEPKIATLWTDRPEFAIYAEYFNTAQATYKLEVHYYEDAAQRLSGAKFVPDLVIGSWLKSSSTRTFFKPLDYFFEDLLLMEKDFYKPLLALGNIEERQYLFPVSFNVPALIYSKENASYIQDSFTLSLDDIQRLGRTYNIEREGVFTRMGFSPRWNDEFLFICSILHGVSFSEGNPLSWDTDALERTLEYIQQWIRNANISVQAEDDFIFKYLYDPAAKLASSGRILFAYMASNDLFILADDKRSALDFRWIAGISTIPVIEGAVYLGICKKGKAKGAADAFVQWFYKEDTQTQLLNEGKRVRLNERLFGIANGFSALVEVNEQIYPQFYPSLLGHVPPQDYLSPPNILPKDWLTLKKRVILPYLHEKSANSEGEDVPPLDKQLSEWYRLNPRSN